MPQKKIPKCCRKIVRFVRQTFCEARSQNGGFDTNWDGHHDGGVVGRGGQFSLTENALSGQKMN